MDDQTAGQQIAQGLFLILGSLTTIPAGIVAGATALASAAGYFFGVKQEKKRARKQSQFGSIEQSIGATQDENNQQ